MKVAIVKERRAEERRVAASPDSVKRMAGLGLEVLVEPGAGNGAAFPDAGYEAAGARIDPNAAGDADLVLKVQRPTADELARLKRGCVLIALLQALQHRDDTEAYARAGIIAFDLMLVPRITRAQSMDVLSSQTNLVQRCSIGFTSREAPQSITLADPCRRRTTLLLRNTGEGRYLWLG